MRQTRLPTYCGSPRAAARPKLISAYRLHAGVAAVAGTIDGRTGEHGVAVLMRYTLRLLTLQQFQRAAALLCACEVDPAGRREEMGRDAFPARAVGRSARPRQIR